MPLKSTKMPSTLSPSRLLVCPLSFRNPMTFQKKSSKLSLKNLKRQGSSTGRATTPFSIAISMNLSCTWIIRPSSFSHGLKIIKKQFPGLSRANPSILLLKQKKLREEELRRATSKRQHQPIRLQSTLARLKKLTCRTR